MGFLAPNRAGRAASRAGWVRASRAGPPGAVDGPRGRHGPRSPPRRARPPHDPQRTPAGLRPRRMHRGSPPPRRHHLRLRRPALPPAAALPAGRCSPLRRSGVPRPGALSGGQRRGRHRRCRSFRGRRAAPGRGFPPGKGRRPREPEVAAPRPVFPHPRGPGTGAHRDGRAARRPADPRSPAHPGRPGDSPFRPACVARRPKTRVGRPAAAAAPVDSTITRPTRSYDGPEANPGGDALPRPEPTSAALGGRGPEWSARRLIPRLSGGCTVVRRNTREPATDPERRMACGEPGARHHPDRAGRPGSVPACPPYRGPDRPSGIAGRPWPSPGLPAWRGRDPSGTGPASDRRGAPRRFRSGRDAEPCHSLPGPRRTVDARRA